MKISLICISLLSVFLLVAIFFVYKQMKKVAAARREVIDTNTLLQELNGELHDSNSQLKEMNIPFRKLTILKRNTSVAIWTSVPPTWIRWTYTVVP